MATLRMIDDLCLSIELTVDLLKVTCPDFIQNMG